jgi:hypothetical protein
MIRVQAVFSDAEIHRFHWDAVAHPLDVRQAQTLDDHIRTVAMGAAKIALIRQADADGEGHRPFLL